MQLYKLKTGVLLTELRNVANIVSAAAMHPIPLNKSIVGDHVFTHESGIHVDGLLKDKRTYESLDPNVLGRSHSIVIGKHSGSAAITALLDGLQLEATPEELREILACVRVHAANHKGPVSDAALTSIWRGVRNQSVSNCV
jgi:homocitrate synthase NifV